MAENGVLITRPEPYASATARLIEARGFTPIVAPLLRVRRRSPMLPDPARLQAILAASSNALPGLVATHTRVPLFAVGDATARRGAEQGFVSVVSAHGDAEALVSLALARLAPAAGPVLLAVGAHRGAALALTLRGAGFAVFRRVLYEASPLRRLPSAAACALGARSVGAALFFSGETARTFARLVSIAGLAVWLDSVQALAISERAAAALRALPFRAVRVALQPTEEALLGMLE